MGVTREGSRPQHKHTLEANSQLLSLSMPARSATQPQPPRPHTLNRRLQMHACSMRCQALLCTYCKLHWHAEIADCTCCCHGAAAAANLKNATHAQGQRRRRSIRLCESALQKCRSGAVRAAHSLHAQKASCCTIHRLVCGSRRAALAPAAQDGGLHAPHQTGACVVTTLA